jgi:hypothetical protein
MKLKLKNTPEQVELIRAMGSRDQAVASEASQAFAAFIGPVVQKVLLQAGTSGLLYSDLQYDEDDHPSLPLDLWYDQGEDYIQVWSQNIAGGLPTSEVSGMAEMKVATYRLDSAVSWLKRYPRRARLDVIGKAIERMSNEILIKQERNAWAVVLRALAEGSTNSLSHVIKSGNADEFVPHDMNRLMTHIKRLNTAFNKGTPEGLSAKGLTDMFLSPELMEQVRSFAYSAVNTNLSTGGSARHATTTGPISLPDNVREDIWSGGGLSSLYGIVLHELIELGDDQKYNSLFGSLVSSNSLDVTGTGSSGTAWDTANDQLMVGVDLSRESLIRPVARQHDSGGTFTVLPDDQFVIRAEKQGFYGFLEEGRVCIDARALVGIVV